jgi:hypothetical protein
MVEGDAEWFDQKKQQALSELQAANPGAVQLYGQLLRENARRAGASPEEIHAAETAQWARHGPGPSGGVADRDAKRPRGFSMLRLARDRGGWAGR